MVDYNQNDTKPVAERSTAGRTIAIVLIVLAAIVAVLFATGFWSADVSGGKLPAVKVSADSGAMPNVDVQSKKIVVGTKSTTLDVPKVETTKTTVSVPTVGVKN
ncbi:hypothetical protein [Novosphingobium lentum]|uniref:hypothetical protein n=1 Tax=Novosphingobium lentum TaxID=145287 RepID=UPI00082BB0B2|nr:hypothetical protein [Novosphingobium lentum]